MTKATPLAAYRSKLPVKMPAWRSGPRPEPTLNLCRIYVRSLAVIGQQVKSFIEKNGSPTDPSPLKWGQGKSFKN